MLTDWLVLPCLLMTPSYPFPCDSGTKTGPVLSFNLGVDVLWAHKPTRQRVVPSLRPVFSLHQLTITEIKSSEQLTEVANF